MVFSPSVRSEGVHVIAANIDDDYSVDRVEDEPTHPVESVAAHMLIRVFFDGDFDHQSLPLVV